MNNYLYEIIEDYKCANTESEKEQIFQSFCKSVWSCDNKRHTYAKTIHFKVKRELSDTETGKIFREWSTIKYTGYKSKSEKNDWCSLIRQKINNIYTKYFDEEVILNRDYIDLLKTPKNLYYSWVNGTDIQACDALRIINDAIANAGKLKAVYRKQKINLSWNEYQQIIEQILLKTFNNCKLIEEYETKGTFINFCDFVNEDNFYISYFCKYLENEMKQWQKKYYKISNHKRCRRCIDCNKLFELHSYNQKRCVDCQKSFTRARKTMLQRQYRVEKL